MRMNSVFSHLKRSVFHFINMYLYMQRGTLETPSDGEDLNTGGGSQCSPTALLSASKKEKHPIHFLPEPCTYLKGGE